MESDIRTLIRDEMQAVFPAHLPQVAPFYQMQEYHLGWRNQALAREYADPGKLLRPILTLMASQMFGGSVAQTLPLAAGIQLIHDFSLIHDDIQDNSDLRRGRTTLWTIWGMPHGINAGDGMFVLAHLAVQRLCDVGLPAERVLHIMRRFDRIILSICEGQYLDMSFEGNPTIGEADYLAMIERKTALLVAACCELGATAAGASPHDAQHMYDFGVHLGLSFQMQDDILGIWGSAQETGKPDAADLLRRKLSLPVIYALARDSATGALHQLYQRPVGDDAGVEAAIASMNALGAQQAVAAMAQTHYERACAALAAIVAPDPQKQHEIKAIADGLLGRRV
jgi:geranylgeranyl diphosphate synthase type I